MSVNKSGSSAPPRYRSLMSTLLVSAAIFVCATTPYVVAGQTPAQSDAVDWAAYGFDPAGTRLSPATQITARNVHSLTLAWTYRTGETRADRAATRDAAHARFEATPIVLSGTMYFNTPLGRVIALDPSTGAQRWVFDAHVDRAIHAGDFAS